MENPSKELTEEERQEKLRKKYYRELEDIVYLSRISGEEGNKILQARLKTLDDALSIQIKLSDIQKKKEQPNKNWKKVKEWIKEFAPWLLSLYSKFYSK